MSFKVAAKFTLITGIAIAMVSTPAYANYQAAQAALGRRDFATAASGFFQAFAYPKDRAEKAKAEWGLAQSLYSLGLYYSASKYYSVIVRRGNVPDNPFFRGALEKLGTINSTISLGQSHVVQLFKGKLDPAAVPGPARGFYFYYLGVEAFQAAQYEKAASFFRRVPAGSSYHIRATFHEGVIANLQGRHSQAISSFQRVINAAGRGDRGDELREAATINIARVHYETRRFRQAIAYYSQIPRGADNNWLDAVWEASWAFFLMQNHNSTLGNIHTIHSPFFENRFFPESFILQSITFLRLCKFDEVNKSLRTFRARYTPVLNDLNAMINQYNNNPKEFFRLVYSYRVGNLSRYKNAWEILDKLSRADSYKEAGDTVRFADRELARLGDYGGRWKQSGLLKELSDFLNGKKTWAITDAGRRLHKSARDYQAYLRDLSEQTRLIQAEQMLSVVDSLRSQLNISTADKRATFIGGMQELNVGDQLEYWPFEGEYWEDELGGYVYNIGSECKKGNDK